MEKKNYRLIASEKNWIESDALMQLEHTASLPGMIKACGMPDIHPGKGGPVGASFLSRYIYPHLIGNDGGCGVGLFSTSLKRGKIKTDKWVKRLKDLENAPMRDLEKWAEERGFQSVEHIKSLGTIGSGNHFAELQKTKDIFDEKSFENAGMGRKNLTLLVHSGSRSFGEELYREHTSVKGAENLEPSESAEKKFIEKHQRVLKWAELNRELIAERFMDKLGGSSEKVLDLIHNSVEKIKDSEGNELWLHRKGAVSTEKGLAVIPGSRGTLTYLVKPVGNSEKSLWSLAHGAGRKWNRGSCRGRLEKKWGVKDLERTDLGSVVICKNKELLYEEAPQAYKNIDVVIKDMVNEGLVTVVATFEPVITYKTRKR